MASAAKKAYESLNSRQSQEQPAWERLVKRLWKRGVKEVTGLQAIVPDGSEGLEQALDFLYGSALLQQRCIFHTLRKVSNKCVGQLAVVRIFRWSIPWKLARAMVPGSLPLAIHL